MYIYHKYYNNFFHHLLQFHLLLNFLLYTCPYHPRLNAIEQFFSQMKHYLKLYKSKNFEELKLNLKNSIKNIKKNIMKIILFMRIIKIFIKIRKQVKNQANIEN